MEPLRVYKYIAYPSFFSYRATGHCRMPRAHTHSYIFTHTRACCCDRIGFSVVFKVLVYFAPGHGSGVTILFRRKSYSINKLDVLNLPRLFLVKVAEHLLALWQKRCKKATWC